MLTPTLRAASLALAFVSVAAAACGGPPPSEEVGSAEAALSRFPEVAEKDLAVVFALDSNAPIRASDPTRAGALLPRTWYGAVSNAFRATDVGDALDTESAYGDWQIISMRIAPCSALGSSPSANVDHLCWPELRIVWQPVIHDVFIHQRFATSFADDRAMHALYDVPAEVGLGSAEAARARALTQQIRAFDATWRGGPYAPLAPRELAEFDALRDRVVTQLLTRVRALREPSVTPLAFQGHGERPESMQSLAGQSAFRQRVLDLLADMARPAGLKTLTAFSLPEGREPAHLDTWIFLSFRGQSGSLTAEDIRLVSRVDGRTLVNVGRSVHATTGADDDAFRSSTDAEVKDSIILSGADIARLKPVLRDRRQRLVPNTGCASCHQMNDLRFDFHNLGYLEDRELTVAPRVVTDVALDLAWLSRP